MTPSWSRFGMSGWTPTTWKTRNRSVYHHCLKQRVSLAIRFDRKSDWRARPPGKRRRQPRYGPHYSDAAIQACLTIKVLFGLPLRQTTGLVAGLVESLLGLVDLDCDVADDSRLCRRQKTLSVAIAGQGRSGPVRAQKVRCTCCGGQHGHTALSFKAEGEGEWNAGRHGGAKRRLWRKTHIGLDEHTLEIRAVEVTGSTIGDAPVLPDLLSRIAPDRETGGVTADGAYDTGKCHEVIAARNASNASAVIAPRKNAKLWQPDTPGARAPKEALRSSKYPGRALAKPDRVPPPKPRRNKDALYEMTWSASCRSRL